MCLSDSRGSCSESGVHVTHKQREASTMYTRSAVRSEGGGAAGRGRGDNEKSANILGTGCAVRADRFRELRALEAPPRSRPTTRAKRRVLVRRSDAHAPSQLAPVGTRLMHPSHGRQARNPVRGATPEPHSSIARGEPGASLKVWGSAGGLACAVRASAKVRGSGATLNCWTCGGRARNQIRSDCGRCSPEGVPSEAGAPADHRGRRLRPATFLSTRVNSQGN